MPAWALRFLPHALVALAVIGAVWWIYDAGSDAAEAKAEKRALVQEVLAQRKVRHLESVMTEAASQIDRQLGDRITAIDVTERTIVQPTIEREITREKRLSDPALGITDGLREAINAARAASACSAALDGSVTCTLSPAEPAR